MTDLLFDIDWWVPTLLAVIGIALALNGNRIQVLKVRNAGLAIVLLAIVWALLSFFVDTDKKLVRRGTNQLIQAVVEGADKKFKVALTPTVMFRPGVASVTGDDRVTRLASAGAAFIGLQHATTQNIVIEQTRSYLTVRCDIFSVQTQPPIETSSWEFVWEKTSDGWKVREIQLLKIKDMGDDVLDDIGKRFGK